MSLLFGVSRHDREQLVSTLVSLKSTTIPGLAAALGWSERHTEKVLRDPGSTRDGTIDWDPVRRLVRWRLAPAVSVPPRTGSPPTPTSTTRTDVAQILPKAWGPERKCPSCQTPLQSSGTGLWYCPTCGRLASRPPAVPATSSTDSTPKPIPPMTSTPPPTHDRRAQEMFAAWATAQPIPCPKCRTPLRHRGVARYVCPACGYDVTFSKPTASGPAPPTPPPLTPAA